MNKERFLRLLNERILILDGGMGTMIQSFKLNEQDYRGERFADFPGQLKGYHPPGCNPVYSSSVFGCGSGYLRYEYV